MSESLGRLRTLQELLNNAESDLDSALDDFRNTVYEVTEGIREQVRKVDYYSEDLKEDWEEVKDNLEQFLDGIEIDSDVSWSIDFNDVSIEPEELILKEIALKLKWSINKTYEEVYAAIMKIFPMESAWDGSVEIEEMLPEDF